jgi:aerobic carbon-monoxide dehydrogenase small subunit
MFKLELRVNGRDIALEVPAQLSLVEFLRERLGLTGTHVGCDTAQCGACTVWLDGDAVKSCNVLAAQTHQRAVKTIEGMAESMGPLHALQAAFKRHHGLQCGFCTPGMIMSAAELIHKQPDADETAIRAAMEGNLCRCTGYKGIVEAIMEVLTSQRSTQS